MNALMAYIMRGRWQAVLSAVFLAIVSLMLMPLSWPLVIISAAVIGLVTLAHGKQEGLWCLTSAALLMGIFGYLILGNPLPVIGFTLMIWFPVWFLSVVLGKTASLSLTLLLSGLLGILFILAWYLFLGDPAQWWYRHFVDDVIPALEKAGMELSDKSALEAELRRTSKLMAGLMAVFMVIGAYLGLFLARRWQAVMYNPGGFQTEYHQLKFGRTAAIIGLLMLGVTQVTTGQIAELAMNVLLLVPALFMLQGLAVGHALAKQQALNSSWLILMYMLLVFGFPYSVVMFALVGMMDNWIDIRRRVIRE